MTIDNLEIEIKSKSDEASKGVLKLASALTTLKQVTKGGAGLTTVTRQLTKLNDALNSFSGSNKQIGKLSSSLQGLSKVGKQGGLSEITKQTKRLNSANAKSKNGLFGGLKLGAMLYIGQRIGSVLGDWIDKSNDYVENLNLFTVSLGEYTEEAKEYAELVGEKMGIDPSEWMRAQGIFNTLATGFGIANDKASIMSKNLTQLSYDISSLYNIKVQDAMTKLQSAFSGELEPVRRLGYDLSQTKLQAIATSKGITKQVSEMNQAEKSMIRYYALMTQVTEAQGDMARTLESPANQLRILRAQIIQTERALGNIFIPALTKVLPYLNAFLITIRRIATELANFFGFELPEFDYSKVNQLGSGISDNFDKATKSAKKLKSFLAGFDELNVLEDNSGIGGAGGLEGTSFDMEIPQYNFMEGLEESKTNEILEKIKGIIEPVTSAIEGFASGIKLAFETINGVADIFLLPWLRKIGQWFEENPNTLWTIGFGLGIIATGLIALKLLGKASEILGLPGLLKKIADKLWLIYVINGKNLIPTLGFVILRFAGVGLAVMAVYSALKLVETIIDIKQGDIDSWEAFRKTAGWVAMAIGSGVLALTAFGIISAGVIGAGIVAIGLLLLKWNDFAFGAQIAFAYLGKWILVGLYTISTTIATVLATIMLIIKEAILGVVWLVAKGIELSVNKALSAMKKVAEVADRVLKTDFASHIGQIDLTTKIETEMSDSATDFKKKMKDAWGDVKEGAEFDVWESDYLKNAQDMYLENTKNSPDSKIFSGLEGLSTDIRYAFEDLNLPTKEDLDLEGVKTIQTELKEQQAVQAKDQLTEMQTANKLNEDLKKMQTGLNKSQLATNSMEDIKLPQIQTDLTTIGSKIDAVRVACENIKINVTKVYSGREYATGGFPSTGSMFIAREAGPEMVGRIGNKTAVANNDQITQGIANAVYNAMVSASANNNQDIKVYISGKQVNASVEKAKREKGTSIMTGGLIYG